MDDQYLDFHFLADVRDSPIVDWFIGKFIILLAIVMFWLFIWLIQNGWIRLRGQRSNLKTRKLLVAIGVVAALFAITVVVDKSRARMDPEETERQARSELVGEVEQKWDVRLLYPSSESIPGRPDSFGRVSVNAAVGSDQSPKKCEMTNLYWRSGAKQSLGDFDLRVTFTCDGSPAPLRDPS
ncbi:hypothetical protein ACQR36_17415 [Rhodococcus erythropolis]|uniref:hypothetical protein n=1 Tax=Rhodococcus erythropolis TaxID=1833 RepID=UPI003D0A9E37